MPSVRLELKSRLHLLTVIVRLTRGPLNVVYVANVATFLIEKLFCRQNDFRMTAVSSTMGI